MVWMCGCCSSCSAAADIGASNRTARMPPPVTQAEGRAGGRSPGRSARPTTTRAGSEKRSIAASGGTAERVVDDLARRGAGWREVVLEREGVRSGAVDAKVLESRQGRVD